MKAKSILKNVDKRMLIIDAIRDEPLSIADILKVTGIKRGTFIYYLNQLERDNIISKERIWTGKKGMPHMIEFNKKVYDKMKLDYEKQLEMDQEKSYNESKENPLVKKILLLIKQNPRADWKELLQHEGLKNNVDRYQITNWLHSNNFIRESFHLTKEGEQFLQIK